MKRILTYLLLVLTAAGCGMDDDASTVILYVTPSAGTVNSGEKIYFDIDARTLNNEITEFRVSSFDAVEGETEIMTTNPGSKSYSHKLTYVAPAVISDSAKVEIIFHASDETGASSTVSYMIKVMDGEGGMLAEKSGITLYSPLSGNNDGFSFRTLQPLKASDADEEDVDLYFMLESQEDSFPMRWGTKTDIVFSKANNYDYASATRNGLRSVLKNSIRTNTVDNLSIDDVILVGREERTDSSYRLDAVGAMKVIAIFDEEGTSLDRMLLNIKTY